MRLVIVLKDWELTMKCQGVVRVYEWCEDLFLPALSLAHLSFAQSEPLGSPDIHYQSLLNNSCTESQSQFQP